MIISKQDQAEATPLAELLARGRELIPERNHHPQCPTHPGEKLKAGVVCCDCVYGPMRAKPEPATPPMFRYTKDGELTGELCPKCESEMYLVRLGSRQPKVRCPCGYEENVGKLSARIGWASCLRGNSPWDHEVS